MVSKVIVVRSSYIRELSTISAWHFVTVFWMVARARTSNLRTYQANILGTAYIGALSPYRTNKSIIIIIVSSSSTLLLCHVCLCVPVRKWSDWSIFFFLLLLLLLLSPVLLPLLVIKKLVDPPSSLLSSCSILVRLERNTLVQCVYDVWVGRGRCY